MRSVRRPSDRSYLTLAALAAAGALIVLAVFGSSSSLASGATPTPCVPQLFFPCATPSPAPSIPTDGQTGTDYAYCYVNTASVNVPGRVPIVFCSVTLGPGTWRFDATGSVQTLVSTTTYYGMDLVDTSGVYYGGAAGVANGYVSQTFPLMALATLTATTTVSLRFEASQNVAISLSTPFFDTGPTTQLIAQRIAS